MEQPTTNHTALFFGLLPFKDMIFVFGVVCSSGLKYYMRDLQYIIPTNMNLKWKSVWVCLLQSNCSHHVLMHLHSTNFVLTWISASNIHHVSDDSFRFAISSEFVICFASSWILQRWFEYCLHSSFWETRTWALLNWCWYVFSLGSVV